VVVSTPVAERRWAILIPNTVVRPRWQHQCHRWPI